jgi:heat shock protein HslJ
MKLHAQFVACLLSAALGLAAVTGQDQPPSMTGEWKLVKIGEREVPKTVMATLNVTAEGKVSGNTGVNLLSGQLAKEKKLFGPLITTRRAGPPEAMEVEAGLTKALDEATRFTITENVLTLFAGETPRLVFEKAARPM